MRRLAVSAAVGLAALLVAGAAEAFTLEPVSPSAVGAARNFTDPDETAPIQRLTPQNGGSPGSTYSFGDSGLSFSINGSRADGPATNYFDASQPPRLAPYGLGGNPFDPFRR